MLLPSACTGAQIVTSCTESFFKALCLECRWKWPTQASSFHLGCVFIQNLTFPLLTPLFHIYFVLVLFFLLALQLHFSLPIFPSLLFSASFPSLSLCIYIFKNLKLEILKEYLIPKVGLIKSYFPWLTLSAVLQSLFNWLLTFQLFLLLLVTLQIVWTWVNFKKQSNRNSLFSFLLSFQYFSESRKALQIIKKGRAKLNSTLHISLGG